MKKISRARPNDLGSQAFDGAHRALAQPGLSNVCTVGDAQQSIYRFRGADVNVFFGYRESLEAECPEAQFVSLPDNFRSHAA